jgi:hypothetical protein
MSVCAIWNATVGAEFAGPVRHLTLERVLAFSGGPFSQPQWPDCNLHTDLDKAREAGLPGIIVSGTQFEGHLIDLLVETFGEDWFAAGSVEAKIPKSLMLGDTVQPKAMLREIYDDDGGRTFLLDIRCENQRGEAVLVGTASCRLSLQVPA